MPVISPKLKTPSPKAQRNGHIKIDLTIFAERINDRERRSQVDALRCAQEQANDLSKVRDECKRQGIKFDEWLKNVTAFGRARAYHYLKFAEYLVTRPTMPHDELWAERQRISGNRRVGAQGRGESENGTAVKSVKLLFAIAEWEEWKETMMSARKHFNVDDDSSAALMVVKEWLIKVYNA